MDYKKKYLKYKQKYKNIKYGGAQKSPPPPDKLEIPDFALTTASSNIPHQPPINMNMTLEDYKTTMNLFYELSQLNLEAEQLHQEILNNGFSVGLMYYSWTWTNGDNHQFADMNIGQEESIVARRWTYRHGGKPGAWDQYASKIIKKSKVQFAFLSPGGWRNASGNWLYGKSTEEQIINYADRLTISHDEEKFVEFLDKIKSHHSKFKVFLGKYDIDISRTIPDIISASNSAYILGQDPENYVIGYNNKKVHVMPYLVFDKIDYWNETQHEWLRQLNNFFMYERKKELYESYCNLRSCDIRDFI